VNSVQLSLIHRNIESSWKATGLHPFNGTPPFTREQEKQEQKDVRESGLVPPDPHPAVTTGKRAIRLTGLVTTEEAIEQIAIAEAEAAKRRVKAPLQKIRKQSFVPDGPIMNEIENCPDLDDVGDYFVVQDKNPAPRPRGRPRSVASGPLPPAKPHRGRGRPSSRVIVTAVPSIPGKRRGRPRKSVPAKLMQNQQPKQRGRHRSNSK